MKNITSITQNNFADFEQKRLLAQTKLAKQKLILAIFAPIQHIIITLSLLFCSFGGLSTFVFKKPKKLYKGTEVLSELYVKWKDIVKFFTEKDSPKFLAILAVLVAALVIVFALKGIIALLVNLLYKKENTDIDKQLNKDTAKSVFDELQKIGRLPYKMGLFNIFKYVAGVLAGLFVFYPNIGKFDKLSIDKILYSLLLGAIIYFAVVLLFNLYKKLTNYSIVAYGDITHAKDIVKKYIDDCERKEKEQEKYLKKLEREKREREDAERRKEQERKRAEENRKKGEEIYKNATATQPYNEQKIDEAARLGCVEACLYLGRQFIEEHSSKMYTRSEKSKKAKKLSKYFSVFQKGKNTEGEFFKVFCQCTGAEVGTLGEMKDALNTLRSLKNRQDFPEKYKESCDIVIHVLVSEINDEEDKAPAKSSYSEPKPSTPKIKKTYCKFQNGNICTYYSTSSYIAKCNTNNPGHCAAALNNNGLKFEFE